MLWHLGNTTIRTPYRLRDALIALKSSNLNGNLSGEGQESALAVLLHEAGVAEVARINQGGTDFSDFGRKWRSALTKLGFITQKFSSSVSAGAIDPQIALIASNIPELSGRPYEITPSGQRLIMAETIAGQQESFLRAILSIKLPSVIEPRFKCAPFSPLKYVIDILFQIKKLNENAYLSFEEIALFVITTSPDDNLLAVVNDILDFRQRRLQSQGAIRVFDRSAYEVAVRKNDPDISADKVSTKAQTLDDYADCTLRYLKATGLFRSVGRGITLSPIKHELAQLIHSTEEIIFSNKDYLVNFWRGSSLPTDNLNEAQLVIIDLTKRIEEKGGGVIPLRVDEDVSLKRHELEEALIRLEEEEYYKKQANSIDEILLWLQALINNSSKTSTSGDIIKIPKGEAPAYFEWAIWRAFLAINSLTNKPWEARRFQIDQDFLPVGTAPGNGPDMIFEFADAILVVEVTLTSSSRQEAAEGEPVRRHVAKYAEQEGDAGKAVYGLFIAINIDSNTAHTFRTGDWFKKDDSKINLEIVPLKLEDFYKLLLFSKDRLSNMPSLLQSVLIKCRAKANQEAPVWKKAVSSIIDQTIRA